MYTFFLPLFLGKCKREREQEGKRERERKKSHKSVEYFRKKVRSDSLCINMCSKERGFKLLGGSGEEGFLIKIT